MTVVRDDAPPENSARGCARGTVAAAPVELLVFVVAVVARLVPVLAGGGLTGDYGYDSGVYFTSGAAFIHGRLPYRDFLLLHPPLLMMVMSPFAALSQLTSDQSAFIVANLAFVCLGGVNAVLVVRVARRMGLSSTAGGVGGVAYALWWCSVQAEGSIRLEPLGNFFVLCALLAALVSRQSSARRWPLLCGLALGAACGVKIWWALPLVLVLAWLIRGDRRPRPTALALTGAATSLLVVNGPFFLFAPSQMVHDVVIDQFTRAHGVGPAERYRELVGIRRLVPHALVAPALILIAVLLLMAAAKAWSAPYGPFLLLVSGAELILILTSPHWSGYYGDYLAPTAALCAAAAVHSRKAVVAVLPGVRGVRGVRSYRGRTAAVRGLATVLSLAALGWISLTAHVGTPFPGHTLSRSVVGLHCVTADAPMALINLNALSRDLSHGCPNWVDVSGRTYGADAEYRAGGAAVPRKQNARWQRDVSAYLRSGDAVILVRPETGLAPVTRASVTRDGAIACARRHCVYRVRH